MHEKQKNEEKLIAFDTRAKQADLGAVDINMKLAQEHGNKLTQTINEKGQLVSIENTSTLEKEFRCKCSN